MSRKCIIFGAGEFSKEDYYNCKLLSSSQEEKCVYLAADGGYLSMQQVNLKPDYVIGDFDSLDTIPDNVKVIKCSSEKDETDLLLCINKGIELGCKEFYIFGGVGGRLDHTMANIQSLSYLAKKGGRGYLISAARDIIVIENETILLQPLSKGYVSIFSLVSTSTGITLEGLRYPLKKATITNNFPIGVSNEFIGETAKITVEDGRLLIIIEK